MKLTAAQAKERILSGNIEGNHEVKQALDLSNCTIAAWPCWKFGPVYLRNAKIAKITGSFTFLDCSVSTLLEIDPALHVEKNKDGYCADFSGCKSLRKVQGNFDGHTNWIGSGIVEIDPKIRLGTNNNGDCADFGACTDLKKVQGAFLGLTRWIASGICEIDPTTQFGVDSNGNSADFTHCKRLLKVQGKFPGFTNWSKSGITEISAKAQLGANNFETCANFTDCQELRSNIYALHVLPQGDVIGNVTFRSKAPPFTGMDF